MTVFKYKLNMWFKNRFKKLSPGKGHNAGGNRGAYWAAFFSLFLSSPSCYSHCCLHASPSSPKIYRGEERFKRTGEKNSIVYWFYNRLSATEIKWGLMGQCGQPEAMAWQTWGLGTGNRSLSQNTGLFASIISILPPPNYLFMVVLTWL